MRLRNYIKDMVYLLIILALVSALVAAGLGALWPALRASRRPVARALSEG